MFRVRSDIINDKNKFSLFLLMMDCWKVSLPDSIFLARSVYGWFCCYWHFRTDSLHIQCWALFQSIDSVWMTFLITTPFDLRTVFALSLSLSQPTLFLKSVACLSRCKCFSSFFYSFAAKSKHLHSLIRLLLFASVFASFILKAQCLGSQNHSFQHEICKIFIRPFQWIKNISQMNPHPCGMHPRNVDLNYGLEIFVTAF